MNQIRKYELHFVDVFNNDEILEKKGIFELYDDALSEKNFLVEECGYGPSELEIKTIFQNYENIISENHFKGEKHMSKIEAITELFLHEAAQDWNKSNKDNLLQHADNHLETTIKNYLEHTNINSSLLKEMAQQGYMPLENIAISKTSDEEMISLITADLKELIYNNLKQQHFNDSQELTR